MVESKGGMLMREFVGPLGMAVALATVLTVLPGCANSGAMTAAQKIHSMTPCGMMMGMAGHDHGGQPNDKVEHTTTAPEAEPSRAEGNEDHLHPPNPEQ
jgi:hypothetical protein